MKIAALRILISIPHANSLKDKRKVVKGLKDRIRNKFNVSVAEIGYLDEWKTAEIGVVVVSQDAAYANGVISRVQDLCDNLREAILTSCELEWR